MPMTSILALLSEKKGSIFLFGVFFAAVVFFAVTATSARYAARTDFMVVQTSSSQDFYTLFKSSEYLSKVLSESMYSERFINAVIETGKVSAQGFLPVDKRERLDRWRSMVSVEKNIELGMLSVSVRADTEREAGKTMEALSDVLINRNKEFRGGDEKAVEIRVLSGPITDRNPTPKELLTLSILGFLAGAFVRVAGFALKPDMHGGTPAVAFIKH
jgi:capsular polysaccharide biosynthesis protein